MTVATLHIALVAGIYLTVTGIGFLVSTDFYVRMTKMGSQSDPVLVNLSGALHLLAGALVLTTHWKFGSVTETAATLVGVAAAIKGAGLIVLPDRMLSAPAQPPLSIRISAAGFLLVGVYLLTAGTGLVTA